MWPWLPRSRYWPELWLCEQRGTFQGNPHSPFQDISPSFYHVQKPKAFLRPIITNLGNECIDPNISAENRQRSVEWSGSPPPPSTWSSLSPPSSPSPPRTQPSPSPPWLLSWSWLSQSSPRSVQWITTELRKQTGRYSWIKMVCTHHKCRWSYFGKLS